MTKISASTKQFLANTSLGGISRKAAFVASGLLAMVSPALAIDDNALPTGGTVAAGAAGFEQAANLLKVNQSSQNVVIDWNSFNIGKNAATQFNQPNMGSIAVNRVHDVNPSQILGNLSANGRVVVLNNNGVIFGQNAKVDVAGLLVSTGDINQDEFMNSGQVKLSNINARNGKIENNGQINVHEGGLAAFVAPEFVNNGVIEAKLGKIAIGAGADTATVDMYGDGLVELGLGATASKAVITNNGTLRADGGTIAVTVKAAKNIVNSVVNMNGIVEANSFSQKNGVISLDATNANVNVGGKVSAKGGGKINIRTNKDIAVTETAELNASAETHGNGGEIMVIADGKTAFTGSVVARGGSESGNGGFAEISGYEALGFNGYANLGASNGAAGTLLLDPEFAIIHSGNLHGFGGYVISAQALANAMESTNVQVQADQFIDVGTKDSYSSAILNLIAGTLGNGDIDVSTYDYNTLNTNGSFFPWNWTVDNHNGTTQGSITLKSDIVNFNKNLTLGDGSLTVDAANINMNAKIFEKNGAVVTTENRLNSNSSFINVLSNNALIQQAINFAKDIGSKITVANGTFTENLTIDKSLTLESTTSKKYTTLEGYIKTGENVDGLTIEGFTFDHQGDTVPGYGDKASIALNNGNKNIIIKDNDFIGNNIAGSRGIVTSTGGIDGARFRGNTFKGLATGIYVNQNSNDVRILGSKFIQNVVGVSVDGKALLNNNQFTNNSFEGLGIGGEVTLTNNQFTGNNQHIGNYNSAFTLDLTTGANEFDGSVISAATDFYALEDKLTHAMDDSTMGKIITKAGEWFVTLASGSIQRGVDIADAGDKVNVDDGVFTENVTIDKSLTLLSRNGRDKTTIEGISNQGALGSVFVKASVNNVTIGDTDKGFKIIGIDNGNPAIENAAVYIQGNQKNTTIRGNEVVANGDGGLMTEEVAIINGITIDNNILSGQTFKGIEPATGNQFTIDNVARQLVVVSGGTISGGPNGGNTSNVFFTNNQINGTTGPADISGKGNYQVTIDAKTATISGNTFGGVASGWRAALRVRGVDTQILNNTFNADNLHYGININNGTNITVQGNTINNALVGIFIEGAQTVAHIGGTNAQANKINGGQAGIYTNAGKTLSMTNNVINGAVTGIYVANVAGESANKPGVSIVSNDIKNGTTGISVTNSGFAKLWHNVVENLSGTGINLANSADSSIRFSLAHNLGGDGITVANSANTLIDSSTIYKTGGDGVDVSNSADVVISNNQIGMKSGTAEGVDNIKGHGITVSSSNDTIIKGNKVTEIGGQYNVGILVSNSNNALIGGTLAADKNTITTVNWDGIGLSNSADAKVFGNTIDNVTGASGIAVIGSTGAELNDNTISNVKRLGIYADKAHGLKVVDNTISKTGQEFATYDAMGSGIAVKATNGVTITGNTIDTTTGDGINIGSPINGGPSDNTNVTVDGNLIGQTGTILGDGIYATARIVSASDNTINNTNRDGIDIANSSGAVIADNVIGLNITTKNIKGNGIAIKTSSNLDVSENQLANVSKAGIKIEGGVNNVFADNTLTNIGEQGFLINGATDKLKLDGNILNNINWTGIQMDSGKNATLINNQLTKIGDDGFRVSGTQGVDLSGNTVINAKNSAITVNGAKNVVIDGNIIDTAGKNGIQTSGGSAYSVTDNTLSKIEGNGIQLINAGSTNVILDNNVTTVKQNGIVTKGTSNLTITGNTLSGMNNGKAIDVSNGSNIVIGGSAYSLTVPFFGTFSLGSDAVNTVSGFTDGIVASAVNTLTILKNVLTGDNAGTGIKVADSTNVSIGGQSSASFFGIVLKTDNGNQINGFDTGIDVADSSNVSVQANAIKGGKTGIKLNDVSNVIIGGSAADKNTISDIALGWNNSGINIFGGTDITVSHNSLSNIGGQGIYAEGAWGVANTVLDISDNVITNAEHNAIYLKKPNGATVAGNTINGTTYGNGIALELVKNAILDTNVISNVAASGINLFYGNEAITIKGNSILNAVQSGINVGTSGTNNAIVIGGALSTERNNITGGLNGITVKGGSYYQLLNNEINTNNSGILVNDTDGTTIISDNLITAGMHGISTNAAKGLLIENNTIKAGSGNGINLAMIDIATLTGNVINDNAQYGMYLAPTGNGTLRLTNNVINSLVNGVGARFETGSVDLRGAANIFNGGTTGLQFNGSGVTLAGNSFGNTVFNGQSGFYIQLSNGALFGPAASPAVLDARQVSFDGFVPGSFTLNYLDYLALSEKLYDFADLATLGSIFFDYPTNVDINDVLPQQRFNVGAVNSVASLTIRGLPFASLEAARTQSFNVADLNNIQTAAGGENSGENLNDIETAAGETTTAGCWSQVYSSLSSSSAGVTYNMDGSAGSLLSDQAGCGN